MEQRTLRETIKEITRKHFVENDSLLFSQNVEAVGWIQGTVPNDVSKHIVELPTSDVSNSGIVVGSAIMSKRPIYVVRFAGFQWYNCVSIINYAMKSKELWQQPCPMFIRSISRFGSIGPVASNSQTSLYYKNPGVKIFSPMTPKEYETTYQEFMKDDDVYYVSEHANSYNNTEELPDVLLEKSDVTLMPIGITRFAAEEARKKLTEMGFVVSVINIFRIKPFELSERQIETCFKTHGDIIVLDDDYADGIAKNIAYDIMTETETFVNVMGLENRTAGFHTSVDVIPPTTEQIVKFCLEK